MYLTLKSISAHRHRQFQNKLLAAAETQAVECLSDNNISNVCPTDETPFLQYEYTIHFISKESLVIVVHAAPDFVVKSWVTFCLPMSPDSLCAILVQSYLYSWQTESVLQAPSHANLSGARTTYSMQKYIKLKVTLSFSFYSIFNESMTPHSWASTCSSSTSRLRLRWKHRSLTFQVLRMKTNGNTKIMFFIMETKWDRLTIQNQRVSLLQNVFSPRS